jgi:hypothetical protein
LPPVSTWFLIAGNVALALTANAVATVWASRGGQINLLFVTLLVVSPIVFLSFGMVSARTGLAVGAAVIDSALTISSILLGLVVFGGWRDLSMAQYGGMALAVAGIMLMQVGKA